MGMIIPYPPLGKKVLPVEQGGSIIRSDEIRTRGVYFHLKKIDFKNIKGN